MNITTKIRNLIEEGILSKEALPILDIEYFGYHDYIDDASYVTLGASFIWKITIPGKPEYGEFYYYVDAHLPFKDLTKGTRHLKNLNALWMTGGGIIEAKDEKSLQAWIKILTSSKINAEITEPLGGIVSNKYTKDVFFPAEEAKDKVRDVSVKDESEFTEQLKQEASVIIKSSRIRYLLNNLDPKAIVNMIENKDIFKCFEKFQDILSLAQETPDEDDEISTSSLNDDDLEEPSEEDFGPEEPTPEELAAIEAEEITKKESLEYDFEDLFEARSLLAPDRVMIDEAYEPCKKCLGFGKVPCETCNMRGIVWDIHNSPSYCPDCNGFGRTYCKACKGIGVEGEVDLGDDRQSIAPRKEN